MVLRTLKLARYSTRALRSASKGDLEEALAWVVKMESIIILQPSQQVFKAVMYLRMGDYEKAKSHLVEVARGTEAAESADDRYIHLYAKARLAALQGSDDLMRQYERKALGVSASPWAKSWAPLD